MRRLFVDSENILDNIIHITDADSVFYLTGVLRLGVGDDLYVSDGTSKAFETRIKTIGKDAIKLEVIKDMPFSEGYKARITLFQGLPKGAKMDEVVRKSTELGVYRIVPTLTKRSVPDISGKNATRLMRWRRIAAEAARQSGRINIPEVTEITKLADVVDALKSEGYDLILVPYEMEENVSIKCALKEMASVLGEDGRFSKIAVFIGPEGGFEADEVDLLVSRGARSVTIGENILRTETAGPAVIAMLMYELEL